MIGNNSPVAPAATTYLPKRSVSKLLSRRIGRSTPSAVVVSAIDTGTKARTKPTYLQEPHHRERQHRRDAPGDKREPTRVLAEHRRLDLVARQQKQKSEPDVGDQLDGVGIGQPQHLRPDEHSAQDKDYDLRQMSTGHQRGHEGRHCRHDRGDKECVYARA